MSAARRRPKAPFRMLSDAERGRRLVAALAERDPAAPLWVFGYGSLIWKTDFAYDRRVLARLPGYRRRFHIWTALARGTPEKPGLGLCLEAGQGDCTGVVFRLDPACRDESLNAIWQREMVTGIYRAQWVEVTCDEGLLEALTFVVDSGHPQYAGPIPPDEAAAIVAEAHGKFGSCHDYLAHTVDWLRRNNCDEPELESLLERVRRIREAP